MLTLGGTSYFICNRLNLETFHKPIIYFGHPKPHRRTIYDNWISYGSSRKTLMLISVASTFSLCMAKRSIGMVLTYNQGRKRNHWDSYELNPDFLSLNVLIPLFQLHWMIFRIGQHFPVYGRGTGSDSTLIVMDWYQDRVLGKQTSFSLPALSQWKWLLQIFFWAKETQKTK